MGKSNIGWTDFTINFYTWNCVKVSEGCRNCYAESMAKRQGKDFRGAPGWRENAVHEFVRAPFGTAAFINSMSDTFHEGASLDWIQRIFSFATQRPDMAFLILTKRIQRALDLAPQLNWHPNIWLGTSVENQTVAWRIEVLRQIPAAGKFVSAEPLLGPVNADWRGIDGVITGGESGEFYRPMRDEWVLSIHDQTAQDSCLHFHKQGAARFPGANRAIGGRTFDDLPWHRNKTEADLPVQKGLFG